jgi:hypothetical protein
VPESLEQRLAALAREVEFPPTPDLAPGVSARLAEPRSRRRVLVPARRSLALAAAALALLAAGAGAVPAVRDAVGDLLGLDGATVERVPELPPSRGGLDLGRPIALDDAARQSAFPLRLPDDDSLGRPDRVYLRGSGRLGQVTLLYRPATPGLPEIGSTGVGLLLTQFRGDLNSDLVQKFIGPYTGTKRVRIDGSTGFWIAGPHTFAYRDADGEVRTEPRLADSTLLWRRGRVLLRLEANLPLSRALEIARSVK